MARRPARRRRRRAVRRRRDPPPRRAAAARRRERDRRRPRGGPARRGDRRARRARRGEPAARAPARAADARALPLGPAVGGARGLPRRARRARRGGRRRARRRAAASCTSGSSRTTRRSTSPSPRPPSRRRAPRPPSRRLLVGAAVLLARRHHGVRRHPRPRAGGAAGHRRELRRADRPRRRAHHEADPRRQRARAPRPTAAARCGSPTRPTGPSRASTASATRPCGSRSAARRRPSRSAAGRCGWPTATAREVVQVDPGANKVRASAIEVGNAPRALAVTAGALWVASGVDGRVRRVRPRPRSRRPGRSRSARTRRAIAAGAGALWVASEEAGTVTRIDPRSGSVVSPIRVGNGPSALAVGEGARLGRQPPRRDAVAARPRHQLGDVDGRASAATRPRWPWARARSGSRAARRAPSSASTRTAPRVVEKLEDRQQPGGDRGRRRLGVGGRGRPAVRASRRHAARARAARARVAGPRWTGCTRRRYTTWASSQFGSLAYDGLVAYRRVEGAAGATLVGALATDVPAPSADRRTYVFTLRPGLRFSDGRPVRPEDVRASMERFLQATRGRPAEEQFPPFYAGIVGARECMTGSAPCELARGIETDARARTVTIHLTRPDADFLHKLAILFAFVVPADSVRRASTGRPPPGTGPYRITAWDSERGGTFVRNPHFRSTPARPGGDGFADRIDVRLYDEPDDRAADRRGPARRRRRRRPRQPVRQPAQRTPPPSARRRVAGPRPQRARRRSPTGCSSTCGGARSTTSASARRSTSRSTAPASSSSPADPRSAQPTCQVLPVALPRLRAVLPVHRAAGAGRRLDAHPTWGARAGSWRRPAGPGERVVVHVPDFRARGSARYYARLLDELGFRTTLRGSRAGTSTTSTRQHDAGHHGPRRVGRRLRGGRRTSSSRYCGCDADADNISRLCDRALDRQIDRAVAAPQTDVRRVGRRWTGASSTSRRPCR